jgi:energy-coupling factor transporter ATP-binding protein EcfA2
MKICALHLQHIRQFEDLKLDFTYPKGHVKAGQPLEKVCFIGTNGTGKSTLLDILQRLLIVGEGHESSTIKSKNIIGQEYGGHSANSAIQVVISKNDEVQRPVIISEPCVNMDILVNSGADLIIHAPAEAKSNEYINGIPKVTVDDALTLGKKNFPIYHRVATTISKHFGRY